MYLSRVSTHPNYHRFSMVCLPPVPAPRLPIDLAIVAFAFLARVHQCKVRCALVHSRLAEPLHCIRLWLALHTCRAAGGRLAATLDTPPQRQSTGLQTRSSVGRHFRESHVGTWAELIRHCLACWCSSFIVSRGTPRLNLRCRRTPTLDWSCSQLVSRRPCVRRSAFPSALLLGLLCSRPPGCFRSSGLFSRSLPPLSRSAFFVLGCLLFVSPLAPCQHHWVGRPVASAPSQGSGPHIRPFNGKRWGCHRHA